MGLVGGTTAENVDYSDVINKWLPIVLAFVLGLSFILLALVVRSLVLSATAVVLNLLSVGAAYGLLVRVFQRGLGAELKGFQQVERVEAWVPVFLFSPATPTTQSCTVSPPPAASSPVPR